MITKTKKPPKSRPVTKASPHVQPPEIILKNVEIESFAVLPENPFVLYSPNVGRNTMALKIDSQPDEAEVYIRLEYQLMHYQNPDVVYAMVTCNFDFLLEKFTTPQGKRNKDIPWNWTRESREHIVNFSTGLLAGIVYTKTLGTYLDPLMISVSGGKEILDLYEKAFPDQKY